MYIDRKRTKSITLYLIELENIFSTFSPNNSIFNMDTFFNSRERKILSDRLKALLIKINKNYIFKESEKMTFLLQF